MVSTGDIIWPLGHRTMDRVHPPGRITCKHSFTHTNIHTNTLMTKAFRFVYCVCLTGALFPRLLLLRWRDSNSLQNPLYSEFFSLHHLVLRRIHLQFCALCFVQATPLTSFSDASLRFKTPDGGFTILIKRPSAPQRNPKVGNKPCGDWWRRRQLTISRNEPTIVFQLAFNRRNFDSDLLFIPSVHTNGSIQTPYVDSSPLHTIQMGEDLCFPLFISSTEGWRKSASASASASET